MIHLRTSTSTSSNANAAVRTALQYMPTQPTNSFQVQTIEPATLRTNGGQKTLVWNQTTNHLDVTLNNSLGCGPFDDSTQVLKVTFTNGYFKLINERQDRILIPRLLAPNPQSHEYLAFCKMVVLCHSSGRYMCTEQSDHHTVLLKHLGNAVIKGKSFPPTALWYVHDEGVPTTNNESKHGSNHRLRFQNVQTGYYLCMNRTFDGMQQPDTHRNSYIGRRDQTCLVCEELDLSTIDSEDLNFNVDFRPDSSSQQLVSFTSFCGKHITALPAPAATKSTTPYGKPVLLQSCMNGQRNLDISKTRKRVTIWQHHGKDNQVFIFHEDGTITCKMHGDHVLHVEHNSKSNGTPIIMVKRRHPVPPQQIFIFGTL